MGQPLTVTTHLTLPERSRLGVLEGLIAEGMRTFQRVGQALIEIRDERLYRADYGTFDDYCRERWGMTRNFADRLIVATETVNNLMPIGIISLPDENAAPVPLPLNEAQVRPLTRLEPEQQRAAWQEVVATTPPERITAARVEQVAARYREPAVVVPLPEPEPVSPSVTPSVVVQREEPQPVPARPWAPTVEQPEPSRLAVHFSSETPEWYTPEHIVQRVYQALGGIDLDPCSNPGVPVIPATVHFTEADDGLAQEWHGRVYMNPPYGDVIGRWVEKLCTSYHAGTVMEAIALVPARTDTAWFQRLYAYPICFVRGRLKFGEATTSAPFPSALVYLGEQIDEFRNAFQTIGPIVPPAYGPLDEAE